FEDVWDTFVMGNDVYFSTAQGLMRWRNGDVKVWKGNHHVSSVGNGVLYVREFGVGLLRLEGDELKLVPGGERFADERIYAYVPYDDHTMLIGSRTQGFFLFDGEKFTPFKTEADAYLAANQIYLPGAVLRDGTFLFGTISGGLVQIDHEGHLIRILNTDSGLPDNTVAYIHEDRDGGVWLALGNGVAYVDFGSPFTVFDRRSGISGTPLALERYRGRLYAGGLSGLSVLNPESGRLEQVGDDPLPSLFLLRMGDVLVNAAMTSGVSEIREGQNRIIRPADNNLNVGDALARSRRDSSIVLLSLRGGFGAMKHMPNGQWLDFGRIDLQGQGWALEQERDGTIWIGMGTSGAYRLEIPLVDGRLRLQEAQTEYYGPEKGLPGHGTHIHRLGEQILASTPIGLFRYDHDKDLFVPDHSIPATRFSPAEETHFIAEDRTNGTAWAEFGYEPFRGVRQPDGTYDWKPFLTNELGGGTVGYILPEGDVVWFATLDGIVRYDAKRGNHETAVAAPIIRSVALRNDSLLYGGRTDGDTSQEAVLEPDETSIQIGYASTSYDSQLTYASFLEGLESAWGEWGSATRKSFTNLAPGAYRFHVRARNLSGTTSDETIYSFSIRPHWYVTWWAYLMYMLIGLGLVGGFVRIRTGQLKARQRELERTVEE
ncbi:MAG: triple tyrosine motif-containing protein, partial [Rhodothermales bacterium]